VRSRIKRLEREIESERMVLVCVVCGKQFVAYGDVALECIAYGWSKDSGEKGYHKTPEDIKQLFQHEHGLETFVEKTSGLPLMDQRVTGLDFGGPLG
jgi:hypothetical protein